MGIRAAGNTGDISFSTSTITVAQIVAPANHRIKIERIRVSFKGTSGTEAPILVQLALQTDAGTMSALTLAKLNSTDDETLTASAQHTATVEPSTSTILASRLVHPQRGCVFAFQLGRDLYMRGGRRLGILLNNPTQAGTVNVSFEIEE